MTNLPGAKIYSQAFLGLSLMVALQSCISPSRIQSDAQVKCACDGRADDTACLQKTIEENQNTSFSSSQTCISRAALTVGAEKRILGNGARIRFELADEVNGFKLAGNRASLEGLKISFHSNSKRNVKAPVWIGGDTTGVAILDNEIDAGGADEGIVSDSPSTKNVTIKGNTIKNAAFGLLVNAHYTRKWKAEQYQSGWVIQNNKFERIRGDAIEINSPIGNIVPKGISMTDFSILDNEMESSGAKETGTGFCIGIAGLKGGIVKGNKMKDCKWQCIHVEDHAHDILIEKNTCENVIGPKPTDKSAWQLDDSTGILVLGSAYKIKILGNQVTGAAGAGIVVGILHTGQWKEWYAHQVEVSGNTVTNSGTYGILVKGYPNHPLDTHVGPGSGYGGNVISGFGKKAIHQIGGTGVTIRDNIVR